MKKIYSDEYQGNKICTKCIMDSSDPTLSFDEMGVCDYCRNFEENIKPNWHPNEKGIKAIA